MLKSKIAGIALLMAFSGAAMAHAGHHHGGGTFEPPPPPNHGQSGGNGNGGSGGGWNGGSGGVPSGHTGKPSGGVTSPVPEPETYAMLMAGLGVMGAVARRRKAKRGSES